MEDEVYTDGFGNYFDASGRQLDIYDLIARGIDVAGAYAGNSPYYSPDDPRYQNRGGWNYPAQGYPNTTQPNAPVSFNPQGFNMPWWALLGLGLLAGSFLLGRRR